MRWITGTSVTREGSLRCRLSVVTPVWYSSDMIHKNSLLTELKNDWAGIEKLVSVLRDNSVLLPTGGMVQIRHQSEAYNIPFLLSYGVLEKVLKALCKQDQWKNPKNDDEKLVWLMFKSKDHLSWKDFDTVDDGRKARNNLAHEAVLLRKDDCIRFITAIRSELVAWAIL